MAVVDTRGTAVSILVFYVELAATSIQDATGTTEHFLLWAPGAPPGGVGTPVTDFTRVLQSMWLSLLREAIVSGTPVTVSHDEASNAVTALQLG